MLIRSAFLEGLRDLLASFGPKPDKNAAAVVLIIACIEGRYDTRPLIVRTLKRLGFLHGHVVIMLELHTGKDPLRHWWDLGVDGRYTLLDKGPQPQPA